MLINLEEIIWILFPWPLLRLCQAIKIKPYRCLWVISSRVMRDRDLETAQEVPFFRVLQQAEKFKWMDSRDKVFCRATK